MIKKFFSTMLLAASLLATSCDTTTSEVIDPETGSYSYLGTMTMDMTYMNMPVQTTQDDITYKLDISDDSATVTLSQVTFTGGLATALPYVFDTDPYMPSLDIVLNDIPETSTGVYEISSITPTMTDGEPYDDTTIKSVSNVEVEDLGESVTVSFDCELTLSFGDITATISFTGDKQ